MKKQLLITLLLLLTFGLNISANLDDFNLGLNYSIEGRYMGSIDLLENNCPNHTEDIYHAAQCYFVLGYNYMVEFRNRSTLINEYENYSEMLTLRSNDYLLNKSIQNLKESIKLSWSNLTDKDLRANNRSGFLTSSLFFITENYLILEDYKNAEKNLEILSLLLSLAPDSERLRRLKDIYNQLYSTLPQKVEIELIGDIDPTGFSQPEIKANIIFESEKTPSFNILHTEFINLNGKEIYDIENKDNTFIFNKKLIVKIKNSFIFPFDTFYSEIFNITPSRIRNRSLPISIVGEDSNLDGIAYFYKDHINLVFKRKIGYRFRVILSSILLIGFLILLNRRIIHMKKSSFQTKILLGHWSFLMSAISLSAFVTLSFKTTINLINIIILFLFVLFFFNIFKKLRRLNILV